MAKILDRWLLGQWLLSRCLLGMCILLLSACGPLVSFGGDEEAQIYSLFYEPVGSENTTGLILYVEEPLMEQDLGGRRVAVDLGDYERTYLKDVRWSAALGDQVRAYLVRAVSFETNAQGMGEGALDVAAACRLGLTVWSFDYRPGTTPADDRVHLSIEASLVRLADGTLLGRKTFDHTSGISYGDKSSSAIVASFNALMREASSAMMLWTDKQLQACSA